MLEDLELKDLYLILNCENYADLKQYYHLIRFKLLKTNSNSRSLLAAINTSSNPIELWWAITSLTSVGVALLPVSIAFLVLTLLLGGVYFYSTNKRLEQQKTEMVEFFQLAELKLAAADVILKKQNYVGKQPEITPVHKPYSKINSVGVTISTTATLFVSYIWGISSILETLGYLALAGSLANPIGIAIAGGIALGIGIYFGYKHYQARKNLNEIKSQQLQMTQDINAKRHLCYESKEVALSKTCDKKTIVDFSSERKPTFYQPQAVLLSDEKNNNSTVLTRRKSF